MKPVIIIFPFDLLAHYLRCIVLADMLRDDYDILFTSGRFGHIPVSHGYKVVECKGLNSEKVLEYSAKFDFSWLNESDLEETFLSQVNVIKEHQPFLVIGDTSHTLKMAAEFTGTQFISLHNAYMSRSYLPARSIPPVHPAYKYKEKLPPKLFDHIINFAEKIAFRQVHKPFRRLRKKYKLRPEKDLLSESESTLNLICDSATLFPINSRNSANRVIGPLVYMNGPTPSEEVTGKLIYVSMGSSGSWDMIRFLNDDIFSEFTIITAGDRERILNAPHIRSYDFIDPSKILNRCSLVICHAGNGTIYQALSNAVPLLLCPVIFEQHYNADAVERAGLGERMKADKNEALSQITRWSSQEIKNMLSHSAIVQEIRNDFPPGDVKNKIKAMFASIT